MDNKWRIIDCISCWGCGIVEGFAGVDMYLKECVECGGSGQLYIRPGGHVFLYPGGEARGMWDKNTTE